MKKPCLTCGIPTSGAHCVEHQRARWRERQRTRDPFEIRLYASAEWRRLARAVVDAAEACAWCGTSRDRATLTAGHIVSVRDAPDRALDAGNVAASCRPCQERAKAEPDPSRWPAWARRPR